MKDTSTPKKQGFFSRFVFPKSDWEKGHIEPASQITLADTFMFGAGTSTIAALYGNGRRAARQREITYQKWARMEGDPIVSSAVQLLVTAALGGHETTGNVVFIEETPIAKENKKLQGIVDDIRGLAHFFNRIAFQTAYTGCIFGDAYARVYSDRNGIVDISTDELFRPQLVQPFVRGGRTVGYTITTTKESFARLTVLQMARLKMPRMQWIPQYGVQEKSLRLDVEEDEFDKLPIMPDMVGGSLLYNAEIPFDNLEASLVGLVGQRWLDSIDEQILTVNMKDMSAEQQKRFLDSVKSMIQRSKQYAEQAVKRGFPVLERIRHVLPMWDDKQVISVGPANGGSTGRAGNITIDDVMVHARLLAGAIGVDLSMLGFADQLSGGLGEGGFFRVSAQAAERARVIRTALEDFFNQIIDIHTYKKHGVVFKPSERPWDINFYGSISALEAEKQRTRADAMNSGVILVQAMQAMKDLGADKEIMTEFLQKTMQLDEDQAKLFAKIVDAKTDDQSGMGGMMPPDAGGGGEEEWGGEQQQQAQRPTFKFKAKKQTEETSQATSEETGGEENA